MNLGAVLAIVLAAAPVAAEPGFTAAVATGLDVGTPFVEVHLGRRFARTPHFALYLD